jgi:hypothetical protein
MREDTQAMIYAAGILAAFGVTVLAAVGTLIMWCEWSGRFRILKMTQSVKASQGPEIRQHAESLCENEKESPTEFKTFMGGVVRKLSAMYNDTKHEFAIIFLSSDRKLQDFSEQVNLDLSDKHTKESDVHIYPPNDQLSNYVAAYSRGQEYAEIMIILLGQLEALMEKFGEDKCKAIVLYTWLLPCDCPKESEKKSCKTAIMDKLGPFTKTKRVILTYTSETRRERPGGTNKMASDTPEMENIVKDLAEAGIEVIKVSHD